MSKNMKNMPKVGLAAAMLVVSVFALVGPGAQAADGLFPNPSKISSIEGLLEAVLNFVYAMSFPIVTGVVLYAAFVMMTSEGKPEKFQRGITIIIYAAIGFIVILLSKGVVFILQSIFGGVAPEESGQAQLCTEGEVNCLRDPSCPMSTPYSAYVCQGNRWVLETSCVSACAM